MIWNAGSRYFWVKISLAPSVEILKNTATSLNCCASPSRPVLRSVICYITLLRPMTRRDFIKPEFSLRFTSWKHMPYRFWGLLDSCLAAMVNATFACLRMLCYLSWHWFLYRWSCGYISTPWIRPIRRQMQRGGRSQVLSAATGGLIGYLIKK